MIVSRAGIEAIARVVVKRSRDGSNVKCTSGLRYMAPGLASEETLGEAFGDGRKRQGAVMT